MFGHDGVLYDQMCTVLNKTSGCISLNFRITNALRWCVTVTLKTLVEARVDSFFLQLDFVKL